MDVIRLITANIDFATGPKRDRGPLRRLVGLPVKLARAVRRRKVLPADPPVVLFVQEAKTGRVSRLLGGLFKGLQGKGAARSGTALYSRGIRLHGLRQWLGGDSSETLPRWVTRGALRVPLLERHLHQGEGKSFWSEVGERVLVCLSVHIFPKRAGRDAQSRYVRKLARRLRRIERRGQSWAVGCDANMDLHAFAQMLGGIAYHGGIEGFVCSEDVVVADEGTDLKGEKSGAFDHPSRWIDVRGVRAVS